MQVNNRMMRRFTLLAFCVWALAAGAARAQVRIYNEQRDEQAQAADKLAETVRNGAIFDKQLKNLSILARKDFETKFLAAKFQMNSDALTILTWGKALEKVSRIERAGSTDLLLPGGDQTARSLADLEQAVADAQTSLEAFGAALKREETVVDPSVSAFFARLGDFKDLLDLAQKIKAIDDQGANKAISQIKGAIDQLRQVYVAYTTQVEAYNKEKEKLADIRLALKKVALQNLQVDEAYWKEVAAIRARQESELELVHSLVNQYALHAFLFGLTDFDPRNFPCDPGKEDCAKKARDLFREAVARAKEEDGPTRVKYNQTLSDSAKELVAHLQNLEKDNQEVSRAAKAALFDLAGLNATPDLDATLEQVIDKLNAAAGRINPNDIAHMGEIKARDDFTAAAGSLGKCKNSQEAEHALRNVLVLANKNVVAVREMAVNFGSALFDLAALLARRDTPARLAELRFAQATRAYSIRKSAVNARAYELVVGGGVKRLALYHKGGVKPETLAGFVHALSTMAISPAILAR